MMENIFDLRRNGHIIAAKVTIIVLFLVSVYSVSSFTESTQDAVNKSFSEVANQNLYSVVDTFTEVGRFEDFRQDPESVGRLGSFYNTLNTSERVTLLSAFAQPITITEFKGGDSFDAWRAAEFESPGVYTDPNSGRDVRDVLSMQMSKNTFDFYQLTLSEGELPDWENIDYSSHVIPVLLGANYAGVYDVGDEIETQLYSQNFIFTVSGFLEPNSSMFYKNDINFFLDDYVMVPYPETLTVPSSEDLFFSGILYFAMANSDLVAPRSLSSDDVISYLDSVGRETGFTNYAVIDVPYYLTQFSLTRALLLDNAHLVGALQTLLGAVGIFVLLVLGVFAYRRRIVVLDVRWKLGEGSLILRRTMASMVLTEWVFVAIALAVTYSALPNAGATALFSLLLFSMILVAIDVTVSDQALRRRHAGKKESR